MTTNPLLSSIVRAAASIPRGSSMANTTPLQRTIIQSRRYQQCTSIRYILTILSAIYLAGCLSYCCYIIITTYHFNPFKFTQQHKFTSSTSITNHFNDYKYNRRYHVFYWEDESDDDTQNESLRHSAVGSTAQLPTAAFASKIYYPWNLFTTSMKDHNYNHDTGDTASGDMTNQQRDQETKNQKEDKDDDDSSSGDNNDDSDDDNTMDQSSSAKHIQPHKKKDFEQSTTTTSTTSRYPKTNKNPAVYGWTPNQYPNPIIDPVHCAVSYILPHLQQIQPSTPLIDTVAPLDGFKTNSTFSRKNDVMLRLCDPDWVLGGVYLEDVAMALYNFSTLFGRHEKNDVTDRLIVSSTSSISLESPTTTNTDRIDESPLPKEDDWNVEVGPSNRRRLLRSDVYHLSTTLLPARDTSAQHRRIQSTASAKDVPKIELAVATVRRMNIPLVLREGNSNGNNFNSNNYYSTYDNDEDDLVNDAAQIFARSLHDDWWSTSDTWGNSTEGGDGDWYNSSLENRVGADEEVPADYGILLFLSVQDRVCFISTGSSISVTILPWWRLDHIITNMKPYLQNRNYGIAILHAIHDISNMLLTGPPTLSDRIHDFASRFGIVIAFAAFTFCFGAWGEYRDRRKRWQYAEQRSKLTSVERQKAQQLQMEFRTRCCPICLENYDYGDSLTDELNDQEEYSIPIASEKPVPTTNSLVSLLGDPKKGVVDEYGIPRRGADGRKIKLLRCGHLFCESCWRSWVHSTACGSPCSCPVCRQDVGKNLSRNRRSQSVPGLATTTASDQSQSGLIVSTPSHGGTESVATRTTLSRNSQSYDSFADHNQPMTSTARIIRVNTMLRGAILFQQTSAFVNRSMEYLVEENNDNSNGREHETQRQRDENTPLLSS